MTNGADAGRGPLFLKGGTAWLSRLSFAGRNAPWKRKGDTFYLRLPNCRALCRRFAPRFFGLTVRDHTRPPVDLWASAGEDTLKGLYLRALKARYDRETDEAVRAQLAMAARFGLAAMEGREAP